MHPRRSRSCSRHIVRSPYAPSLIPRNRCDLTTEDSMHKPQSHVSRSVEAERLTTAQAARCPENHELIPTHTSLSQRNLNRKLIHPSRPTSIANDQRWQLSSESICTSLDTTFPCAECGRLGNQPPLLQRKVSNISYGTSIIVRRGKLLALDSRDGDGHVQSP